MKRYLKLGVFFLVFICIGGGIITTLDRNLQAETNCIINGALLDKDADPSFDYSSARLHVTSVDGTFNQAVNVHPDGVFVIDFGTEITTPPPIDVTLVFDGYTYEDGSYVVHHEGGDLTLNIRKIPVLYQVSGRVEDVDGNALEGVSVQLNSETPFMTQADGLFNFQALEGSSIVITPTLAGKTFTPTEFTIDTLSADTTDIVFQGVDEHAPNVPPEPEEPPLALTKPVLTHKNSEGNSLASYKNEDEVEVTLGCTDASLSIYYTINDGSELLYDGTPFKVHSSTQNESSLTISAYTTDGTLKSEATVEHITFLAKSSPPSDPEPLSRPIITHQNGINQSLDTYKNDDVVTVTLTCDDTNLRMYYKLDNEEYVQYSTPFTLQAKSTTSQDIQIFTYSTDGTEASDPTSEVISFAAKESETPDPVVLAKPTIIHKNTSGVVKEVYKHDEEVNVTLQTTDTDVDLYYKVNDGSETKYTGVFKVKALVDESHSQILQTYAYDGENYSEVSKVILSFSAKESTTPTPTTPKTPTIKHANQTGSTKSIYLNDEKVSITLSSTETGVQIYYKINDGIATLYNSPITLQAKDSNAESKTIKVYAQKDGKQSESAEVVIKFAEKGKEEAKDFVDEDGNQYEESEVKLYIESVDEATLSKVKTQVLARNEFKNVEQIAYMEIHLKAANTMVQPNGLYSFVIPYPEGTSSKDTFYVLHILGDNKSEIVEYEKQSDGIHVSVTSFSPFVVGVVKDTTDNTTQDNVDDVINNGVKTGDSSTIAVLTILTIASASWIMIGYRKRREE